MDATAVLAEPIGPRGLLGQQLPLSFAMDQRHAAHEPPEARGTSRDAVRMMVSQGDDQPVHAVFSDLPTFLHAGDLIVVNISATVPAAVDGVLDDGSPVVVHVAGELPGGLWMMELRQRVPNGSTRMYAPAGAVRSVLVAGGVRVDLLRRAPGSRRLWLVAVPDGVDLLGVLDRRGRPIRYPYVGRDWPLDDYRTVFSSVPGSAEMPSASRPFSTDVVAALVRAGVTLAPLILHTGVSSLEGEELPYPERFEVPAPTAALVNAVRAGGGRVIATGTTVVRALETAADERGVVHPASGWTDVVITPARGVRAVDGLITGWHEPGATHLAMLEAVAGRDALVSAYESAFAAGYLWHEFGDSHLLLPCAGRR